MKKELNDMNKEEILTNIGHQITTDVNFRKSIWVKFVKGIKEFKMINKGDKIAWKRFYASCKMYSRITET